MTLLDGVNKQQYVSDRIPMPVDILSDTSYVQSITGETVQLYYFANAFLTCAAAGETTATVWAALTDTSTFEIEIYNKTWLIEPDFTGDASMANVAASIQTAIRTHAELSTVTCAYSTDHFVITAVKKETYSAEMGNQIGVLSNPLSNAGGTDIAGSSWMNGKYGSGVVTPATLTADAGQAAGTVVMAKLAYSGVLDSLGIMLGNSKDTSLVWTTGTVLPNKYRKPCPKYHIEKPSNIELVDIAYAVAKELTTSGEWAPDHRSGMIIGRKATTGTSDTATYKVQTQTTGGGTSVTESINVAKIAGATVALDDAAFGVGTAGVLPAGFFADETATDSVDEGDVGAIRMTLTRKMYTAPDQLHDEAVTAYAGMIAGEAKTQDGSALPNNVAEGDVVRAAYTEYGVAYSTIVSPDGSWTPADSSSQSLKVTDQSPVNQQSLTETLIDTTNVAAATNYYPSSSGGTMDGYRNLSIGGQISGGVTATIEISDDATDWYDATPAGYELTTNTTGNASFVDTNFKIDFDELNTKYWRIKSVTADATNGVQYNVRRMY